MIIQLYLLLFFNCILSTVILMLTSKSKKQLCRNSTRRSSISIDSVKCNPHIDKNLISCQNLGSGSKTSTNGNQFNNWHNVSLSGKILREIVQYTSNKHDDENYNFRQNINPNTSRSPFGKKKNQKSYIQIKDIDTFSYSQINNEVQLVLSQQQHNASQQQYNEQEKNMMMEDFQSHMLRQDIYTEKFENIGLSLNALQNKYNPLSENWQNLFKVQSRQKQCQIKFDYMKRNLQKIIGNLSETYQLLYSCNKRYLQMKSISQYTSRSEKQRLLLQAQQYHEELRRLVSPKFNFQEIIQFNIRVLLPSGHSSQKFIPAGKFQELFKGKTIKKLSMIVKKHSMSSFDMKLVSDYLKKLIQLETNFNKIIPNEQSEYKIGHFEQEAGILLQKISELNQLKNYFQSQMQQITKQKNQNVEFLQIYKIKKNTFIQQRNIRIQEDYKRDGNNEQIDFVPLLQKQYNEAIHNYMQKKFTEQNLLHLMKKNLQKIHEYRHMLNT